VFYDVGSHAGFWPVVLSRRCSRIFAFEPSPENFTRLCQNVDALANVTPVNVAASDAPGVLRFSENGSMSTVTESAGIAVRAIRLDDFVADGNAAPGIIKIDVEGHGARCLAGMQRILERHRPVLFMEVHNVEEEKAATTLPRYATAMLDIVRRFPYRIHLVPD
jgi:FkbM family methyltransferase